MPTGARLLQELDDAVHVNDVILQQMSQFNVTIFSVDYSGIYP
jgi:hypothetical protein